MDVAIVIRPRLLARILASLAAVLALLSVVGQLWEVAFGGGLLYGLIPLLNVDVEGSLSTFFQALLLLFAAGLSWICGSADGRAGEPWGRTWFFIAIAFAYLAVDEATQLHEALILPMNRLIGTSEIIVWVWLLPALPVLMALAILIAPFLRGVDPATRRSLLIAAALYLGGTVLMELVNGWAASRFGTFTVLYRVVLVTLEETLEAAGLIVLIVGLLRHLDRHGVCLHVRPRAADLSGS